MRSQIYYVTIAIPNGYLDDYKLNAERVKAAMHETLTSADKVAALTKGAELASFDTQLEITPEAITAVIEYACEPQVKLQKMVLKNLLQEAWPWPKLTLWLSSVSNAEPPAALA